MTNDDLINIEETDNEDIILDDIDMEESEETEEDAELRDFDLELLLLGGVVPREIDFFNKNTKRHEKMVVNLKSVTHEEWAKAEAKLNMNKKNKNTVRDFVGSIVSKSWVDNNEELIPISIIRKLDGGVLKNIYAEVKIVSGQFEDKTEDKLIEKLAGF